MTNQKSLDKGKGIKVGTHKNIVTYKYPRQFTKDILIRHWNEGILDYQCLVEDLEGLMTLDVDSFYTETEIDYEVCKIRARIVYEWITSGDFSKEDSIKILVKLIEL